MSPRSAAAVLALAFLAGCGDAEEGELLSAAEVRELFSEARVEGHHEKRGFAFRSVYLADGVFYSNREGETAQREGAWRVQEDGNICIRWKDDPEVPDEYCRRIARLDGGRYRKVLVKPGGKRVLIVSYERIAH